MLAPAAILLFQTTPHTITACLDAISALGMALGSSTVLSYTLQGLFHPARKVRNVYWKVFNNLYIRSQVRVLPRVAVPR